MSRTISRGERSLARVSVLDLMTSSVVLAMLSRAACALGVVACAAAPEVRAPEPCLDDTCVRGETRCAYGSDSCTPPVSDPVGQVEALRQRGDAIGFHRGTMTPTRSKHWQSIQRLSGDAANWFVVTRSTSRVAEPDIGLVQIASRPSDGVALRANRERLRSPPTGDRVAIDVDTGTGHTHAGGTQLVGRILAVPLEANVASSCVSILDLRDPAHPRIVGNVEHRVGAGTSAEAGTASLARLADGRYLLVIGRRDAETLDFYLSSGTDVLEAATTWIHHDTWHVDELRTAIEDADYGDYQNLNFVTADTGQLFLLGLHEDGVLFKTHWADLFALRVGDDVVMTKVAKRQLSCGRDCNLDAGAGAYVDPSARLLLYGIEHASNGPEGTVSVMEF